MIVPITRKVSTACATLLAVPAYAFLLLMRWTPYHPGTSQEENNDVAGPRLPLRRHRSVYLALLFAFLYRRSAVHTYLHRNGYPCRFIPSCTDYAVRAVEKYGLVRGIWMTAGRLRRCSPSYLGDYVDFP
jgi:putative component of membrane protein insertase Oxa1/YidC/SpoIIIJ protein YidD